MTFPFSLHHEYPTRYADADITRDAAAPHRLPSCEGRRGSGCLVNAIIPAGVAVTETHRGALRHSKESVMASRGFMGRTVLASGLAIVIAATLAAVPAAAAERGAHAPRGDATRHTEHARTEHGRTRHYEWTGSRGQSASRDATVVNDRGAGTHTRDVAATGPNGRQATRHDVVQRTADGHTRDSTVTLPDGRTATRDATVVNDRDAGTRTRDVVTTGPNGGTRTLNDEVQRTEGGFTRSTSVTSPNGSSATRDVTATRDPATGAVVKDVNVDRTPAPRQ
jgi:hypothetical protein